jgi:low affinity Fe/Cu permease
MHENEQTHHDQLKTLPKAPMSPLQKAAEAVNSWSAGSMGTATAILIVLAWAVIGSTTSNGWDYGDRLITAISFLLLFLLQRSQKKDTQAIQLKLNELLAALHRASPKLINIEDESEEEVEKLHQRFQDVQAKGGGSHSIDEAEENCPQ